MGTIAPLTKVTLDGFLLTTGYTAELPDLAFHEGGNQFSEVINPQMSLESSSGQDYRMQCLSPG